jgi:hypothetical protein
MKTLYKLLAIVMIFGLVFTAMPMKAVQAEAVEVNPALQAGADRLTALQNNDGGWDWDPADDGNPNSVSPLNTIGPIGVGLAQAYRFTGDADHLAALQKVGDLLLTKVGNFSPSDGELAVKLDEVFGGSTYTDYVKSNFYDLLAAGTYYRIAEPTIFYNTATYVNRIRASRSGSIANLAAWDIGTGLVGAALCGASTSEWIAGTKAEIDELNSSGWYDVVGLAGALYGLAYVGEEFDPTSGAHAAASNLADLAAILASYQIDGGGFAWNSGYVIPDDYNEAIQETAYAILALNNVNRTNYLEEIRGAADYMLSVQLANGGWNGDEYSQEENNEITGEALWAIAATYPMPEVWVCETGDCEHPGFEFATIQGGINAVDPGGIVHVADGTYTAATEGAVPNQQGLINIYKSVTVVGDEDADEFLPVIDATGVDGVFKIHWQNIQDGTVVLEGLEMTGIPQTSVAITGMFYQVPGHENTVIIRNNKIHGMNGAIDFWGTTSWVTDPIPLYAVTSNIIITGNEIYDLYGNTANPPFGVMIEDTANWAVAGENYAAIITNNVFSNFVNIESGDEAAIILPRANSASEALNVLIQDNTITSTLSGPGIAITGGSGVDHLEILENKILSSGVGVLNGIAETVDASVNWWGSMFGPAPDAYYGDVDFIKWCGDAECSFLLPDNNNVIELSGNINVPGGIEINQPHLTILLKDGTVIENDSPCFIINASYTTITTESIGGAKCIPTNGSNGIDVAAGLVNIVVDGLEITKGATATGDGIAFAGAVTDIVLVDNWIHGLDGDGISFAAAPAGVVDINGNLFQDNVGNGIEAGDALVFAHHNSWGSYGGPGDVGGDGISWNVEPDPFTHVDLYLVPSGTPWANQVVNGSTITYEVKAHMVGINAADFVLTYDPALLSVDNVTEGTDFVGLSLDDDPLTYASLVNSSVPGELHFSGFKAGGPVDGDVTLFSVTFDAIAAGTSALNFDEATDLFGMPGAGSSSNVYAAALTGGSVKVIDLPVISSSNMRGYFLTGEEREYSVSVTNPTTGGNYGHVIFRFDITGATLADVTSLKYFEVNDSLWYDLPLYEDGSGNLFGYFGPAEGFPMSAPYTATSLFRLTSATAGAYPFVITLIDLDSVAPANFVLSTLTETTYVFNKPVLTTTGLTGDHQGLSVPFTLNINNMSTMVDPYLSPAVTFLVDLDLPDGTVLTTPGGDVTCTVDGCAFPVTLAAGANAIPLTAVFTGTQTVTTVPVALYDNLADPDRLLASASFGPVAVFDNIPAVLGTVSMQGRTTRAGVPVTLTAVTVPYGPYLATSIEQISNNLSFANVAEGSYTITTNQPRYLNITAALGKVVAISDAKNSLASLELKGGNANWTDNIIDIFDAVAVGTTYGTSGDGDVNFDGKVNIQDLALVGGNYRLTSAVVYGSWVP